MRTLVIGFILAVLVCGTAQAAPPEPTAEQTKRQVHELQQTMLGDNEIMAGILMLKDDPDVQALLNNPDVRAAIESGDIAALAGNPRFLELLNKPQIKDIQKRIDR